MTAWPNRRQEHDRLRRDADRHRYRVRVTGPAFVASLEFDGGQCVGAPEHLSAAVGQSAVDLWAYFERRGWQAELVS